MKHGHATGKASLLHKSVVPGISSFINKPTFTGHPVRQHLMCVIISSKRNTSKT